MIRVTVQSWLKQTAPSPSPQLNHKTNFFLWCYAIFKICSPPRPLPPHTRLKRNPTYIWGEVGSPLGQNHTPRRSPTTASPKLPRPWPRPRPARRQSTRPAGSGRGREQGTRATEARVGAGSSPTTAHRTELKLPRRAGASGVSAHRRPGRLAHLIHRAAFLRRRRCRRLLPVSAAGPDLWN